MSVETISANGTNEHTIRVWVSSDAPVSEQSKIFQGQVFITGGQGIEVPECFAIAYDGTLLAYNYECGLNVVIPAEINGIKVKEIYSTAFSNVEFYYGTAESLTSEKPYLIYLDATNKETIESFLEQNMCEGNEQCNLEDLGVLIFGSVEDFNSYDWSDYDIGEINGMIYDEEYIMNDPTRLNIESLDLSQAKHLETIGYNAFDTSYESDTIDNELCLENYTSGKKYICYGSLKKVSLPLNGVLKTIDGGAFNENQLTEIIIPNTVKNIGSSAFKGNKITSVKIPYSVEVIEARAFYRNNISELKIEDTFENPSNLTNIKEWAFADNNLTEIVLPKSLVEISYGAFAGNPDLMNVIVKNNKDNINILDNNFPNTVTITYDPNYTE